MTAQDADDSDTETEAAVTGESDESADHSSSGQSDADEPADQDADSPDPVVEALSEIAEAPEGNVSATLEAIARHPESANVPESRVSETDSSDTADGTASRSGEPATHSTESEDVTVSEEFVAELEATPTETVARSIVLLREELSRTRASLEETRERADDLESRLKRKQADFQNYKKRQKERLETEKQRATEDLVERLLDVRDNLERALKQDADADIRGGVESTLEQFDTQLERENVEPIEPEPGDSTDPKRHEVLATVTSDRPEDTIATVHRPGYEMANKVIRPAQVAVSDGSGDGSDG